MDAVDDTSSRLGPSVLATEETPSLLNLVVDLNLEGWNRVENTSFRQAIASALVLVNAHLALNNANEIAVIGYNINGTKFYVPQTKTSEDTVLNLEGVMYSQFQKIDQQVLQGLEAQLHEPAKGGIASVSAPLSFGLCYANRRARQVPGLRARTLVISVSDDESSHHIATMNSIFAAQKLKMPIDVCNIRGDRPFLQQAADFTGGVYINVETPEALVQYLMSAFGVEPSLRDYVNLATQHDVNFSAVCYITKQIIEIGFVCSVCLTIMKDIPETLKCPVCSTHFEIQPRKGLENGHAPDGADA